MFKHGVKILIERYCNTPSLHCRSYVTAVRITLFNVVARGFEGKHVFRENKKNIYYRK